jgi:hypothetical protein
MSAEGVARERALNSTPSCDWAAVYGASPAGRLNESVALERAVDYVLDDCFFTVGQMVGMRMTVDYDAVVWWRDHFRAKFLAAMQRQGNRWIQDRQNVSAVGWMLAERAVRYASHLPSINVDAARKAAADVERYCAIHARRRAAALKATHPTDDATALIAGYWCTPLPPAE